MKLSYLRTVINNTPENRRALPENISLVEIREAKSPCRFETKLASYVNHLQINSTCKLAGRET